MLLGFLDNTELVHKCKRYQPQSSSPCTLRSAGWVTCHLSKGWKLVGGRPQPWLSCKQVHDGPLTRHPADAKMSVTLHLLLQDMTGRFFGSSWVVEWAPGHYADVAHSWESYRAARAAMAASLSVQQVRDKASVCYCWKPPPFSAARPVLANPPSWEEQVPSRGSTAGLCPAESSVKVAPKYQMGLCQCQFVKYRHELSPEPDQLSLRSRLKKESSHQMTGQASFWSAAVGAAGTKLRLLQGTSHAHCCIAEPAASALPHPPFLPPT